MTVEFDEIQMGEAIDQPRRCDFADTAKIIGVNCVHTLPFELRSAVRHAVEHLIRTIEEMNRAKDKIELVPMLLNPVSASHGVDWVVIELDARADSQIRIFFPQAIDFTEVNSGVITIMISESDVG